ncbi:carbohydrate kinase [Candidatus Bipolaricaulota bacterium]|nr:carbohydrate kinase [Candidatus Bipolaricaulota bacterium]
MKKFEVMLLGHFTKDREVVGQQEADLLGGAVYFGAFPLKKMGVKVGVVTKLAEEDFSGLTEFKEANIPVFASRAPETTGMKNVYPTEKREERKSYQTGFAGPFDRSDLPEVDTEIFHIGALLRGEVSPELIKHLSQGSELGLDLQGFVRKKSGDDIVLEKWEKAGEVLPYVTYLKADDNEAEILTGEEDLTGATKELARLGPEEVVVTHDDGVIAYTEGKVHRAPFRPKSLDGRTGRGDTCMATYLGKRSQGSTPEEAIRYAAALTTLKLEEPGPFNREIGEVKKLLEEQQF